MVIHMSFADTHYCDASCYEGPPINCAANEHCNVTCAATEACRLVEINCPSNYECRIDCSKYGGCNHITVNAALSSLLVIDCVPGLDTCTNINVYCPQNIQGVKKCIVYGDNGLYASSSGGNLQFYAVNGWNDMDIIYSGSWFDVDGQMHCNDGVNPYGSSCNIKSDAWTCQNSNDGCNNPPTMATPTSSTPTTSYPTTNNPTTISPTSSAPTTTQPTTLIPTAATPTSSYPTTTSPTSSAPTTTLPTTSMPTTATPTNNPTTTSPTYSAPTTTQPTTLSPTTNIPSTSTSSSNNPTTMNGESNEIYESTNYNTDYYNGIGNKINKSSDNYLWILYIIIAFFLIIVAVIMWRLKKHKNNKRIQEQKNITNHLNVNTCTNNIKHTNELMMSSSPISCTSMSTMSTISTTNNTIEGMTELQLTSISTQKIQTMEHAEEDDDIYDTPIITSGNNALTKGQTKGNANVNIIECGEDDMDGMYETTVITDDGQTKGQTKQ